MTELSPETVDQPERWKCGARQRYIGSDVQDCDWPFCGCDPYAIKVLDAIAESGFDIVSRHAQPAPLPETTASLTERLIQAAVDYEVGRCSKRELSEARAAVESAISASAQPAPSPETDAPGDRQ